MTNEEVRIYEKPKKREFSAAKMARKLKTTEKIEFLEYLVVFLLCRLEFLGGLSPFGIAYFAAVFPNQKRCFGILFACLGIIFGQFGILTLKYVGAITIVASLSFFLREELGGKKIIYSLIASAAIAANGFIYVAFDGFLLYDILFLFFETVLTFFSFFAFDKAIELIRTVKNRNYFEAEETVSMLMLCAGIVLSLKTLPTGAAVSHIISISILLILGYSCGSQTAAAGGIVLGLANAIGAPLASQTVSVYALCGFGCGLFKKFGKWAVCLSFFIINALFMMYFNSSADRLLTVGFIGAATVVLYILPPNFLGKFGEIAENIDGAALSPYVRLKEILTDKILKASESFSELYDIFTKIVKTKVSPEFCDVDRVYDRTYTRVCKGCSMNKFCWQKKANDTYDALGKMYDMMKVRGFAIDIDAPKYFRDYCINYDGFVSVLNNEYEHFRVNSMWAGKIIESRMLIANQFRCISGVLDKIKADIGKDFSENIRRERKILTALDKKGITVSNVSITHKTGYEVTMDKPPCDGKLECSKIIASAVSEVLEVPMLRVGRKCGEKNCKLRFCEQARYRVETGSASISKNGEETNGDNFSAMMLDEGKFIVLLSDGEGSGKMADAQSKVTIQMLKKLVRAGFDKETAVGLLNSILISQSAERFATIDICIINLYTAKAEFLKTGAADSYIKSKTGVDEIKSHTLPAGVAPEGERDLAFKTLMNEDFVIMLTDGVTEAFKASGADIKTIFSQADFKSPKDFADAIIDYAKQLCHGKIKDDMTAFVMKIIEEM